MMPNCDYNKTMLTTNNRQINMDISPAFDAQETSLAVWLEKIAAKDESVLATFYDATVNRVYGLALRITRASHVAEEVVSDVYWQVWQQADRYDATHAVKYSPGSLPYAVAVPLIRCVAATLRNFALSPNC